MVCPICGVQVQELARTCSTADAVDALSAQTHERFEVVTGAIDGHGTELARIRGAIRTAVNLLPANTTNSSVSSSSTGGGRPDARPRIIAYGILDFGLGLTTFLSRACTM